MTLWLRRWKVGREGVWKRSPKGLSDVEYLPERAICPLCRQSVWVTHRYHGPDPRFHRIVGIAMHLSNGREWCLQRDAYQEAKGT